MKKLYLFICVLFITPYFLYAQHIPTTISAKVVAAEERDSLGHFFYPYRLNVTQDLDIRMLACDTLHLKLDKVGFFQAITCKGATSYELVPDMVVYAKRNRGKFSKTDFSFDGVNLIIPRRGNNYIRVSYGYYSDLCFRTYIPPLACGLLQFDADSNSWYFTAENNPIVFDRVCFTVPDSTALFVNCKMVNERNGGIALDLTELKYKNISLYLVDKKWYDLHTMNVGDKKIDLFLSKRDTVEKENEWPRPLPCLPDSYIAERKQKATEYITRLNHLFPEVTTKEITILEDLLMSFDKKYGYGKALIISDEKQAVFIDRTFWNTSLVHELVHCYLNYNYERIAARYFFDESLIEYFANYVYYPDAGERDRAFMDKIEYFLRLPASENCSIFDVQKNHVDTETGAGTMGVVYYKVPFLIHQFAKRIGEERFISAVRSFNLLIKQGSNPEFEDFGKILLDAGVSEKDWEQFSSSL